MLWRATDLIGHAIRATDGAIGTVKDLLLDDRDWTIRWAVVDTGTWLPGHKVLLPPGCFGEPDRIRREIPVDLTRDRVKDSPDVETDRPVSRQVESDLYGYYGWAPYWGVGYPGYYTPVAASAGALPPAGPGFTPQDEPASDPLPGADEPKGDPDLRSANEVVGYGIHATDGAIGHVEDLLIETGSWRTRYLLVDTRNWLPGKMVLIAPDWAESVSWTDRTVSVSVSRERVEASPEYDPNASLDRGFEERLHDHYGYRPYWRGI